ncbi:MAG: hypothetical protein RL609_1200 [Bacteroidota bacterium]|jgi:hypothetical protein
MRKIYRIGLGVGIFLGLGLFGNSAFAQSQKKGLFGKKKQTAAAAPAKKEEDKYADILKKCKKIEGLFNLYRDTTSGKVYMEISKAQLGQEFIYFSHIVDAPVETGYHRGSFGDSKIIQVEKWYDKIAFVHQNTHFYYDPNSPLSKAADANINDPILATEKIEATSKDQSKYLIDGDALFLTEKMQLVKYPSQPGQPSALGSLSSNKTHILQINSYPENTEIKVEYVYENSSPQVGSAALEDARNVSIQYQHSWLSLPAPGYQPRKDDPRVGYFSTQIDDMTTYETINYRDVIHRWRLEKKNPELALSEPVKPITFWIENTTPYEWRPLIKEACERWNIAFEKAGFKNAVVCLEQPEDATWDAGDIRYNVLRWSSTPEPPFGGYGPSFVDPRTGEILGADIMLEFVAIINRVNAEKFFKGNSAENDFGPQNRNPFLCAANGITQHQMSLGSTIADAFGMGDAMKKEVARQLMYRLILHEVGHTLGLTHNMRASTLQKYEDIKNVEKVKKEGLANSIMEYPAFNYQLNEKDQAGYCDEFVGPYDWWVIEYGYSPALTDPTAEAERLKKITDRSVEHQLAYGNDADDMRSPGRGIDPDVNIYDLTSDPVAYAVDRCVMVNALVPKLKDKLVQDNESYQEMIQAFNTVTNEYSIQLGIMTRQMAGVHYNRAFKGQNTQALPLTPVSLEKQKAAMKALSQYAFAPKAFDEWNSVYAYMLVQRRGFNHFSENDDPNIHARVMGMQKGALSHLLHPNVLLRFTDASLYGNAYKLDAYMNDLSQAIFAEDLKGSVNTFRQNLQMEYVNRLIKALDPKNGYDYVSRGMVVYSLNQIDSWMKANPGTDVLTQAHRAQIRLAIEMSRNN